jgi:hypothetical protein
MLQLVPWLVCLRNLGRFCAHRHTRYILAWLLTLGMAAVVWQRAYDYWLNTERNDGHAGHTTVDFGSSWVLGRMLVCGEGWYLYDRTHMFNVVIAGYPHADQDPNADNSDAAKMISWFVGEENPEAGQTFASCVTPVAAGDGLSAVLLAAAGRQEAWTEAQLAKAAEHRVTGPLYPPIHAFVAAPLGLLEPHEAYLAHQAADLVLVVLAAWGVSVASGRRLWVPAVAPLLLLYPGFFGGMHLSQTSTTALTVLVWGWALIARGRPAWGGAVWGLLAFKPVWAVSFFPVLLLSRRWRAALAMLASGAGLAAFTLPFVGLHSWLDWLNIGWQAAEWYKIDKNWIHLSRDLLSIPRRYLIDFSLHFSKRDVPEAAVIGWAMVLTVVTVTTAVALLRARQVRAVTGPGAAFLLLGGWLCCFHFMFYDAVLTFLPVLLLLADPRWYFRPRLWERQPLEWEQRVPRARRPWGLARAVAGAVAVFRFPAAPPHGERQVAVLRLPAHSPYGWLRNAFPLLALLALLAIEGPLQKWRYTDLTEPMDTFALIVLWAWCGGWVLTRRTTFVPEKAGTPALAAEVAEDAALPDLHHAGAESVPVTPAPAR